MKPQQTADTNKEIKREVSAWVSKISKMETVKRNLEKILTSDTVGGNWRRDVMMAVNVLAGDISYQKRLLAENLDSLKARPPA